MSVTSYEALKVFGDPRTERYMALYTVPKALQLPVLPKNIYCNIQLIKPLEAALTNVMFRKLSHEIKTWDGCFNIRQKKGNVSRSLHSWGLAVDINAAWNPFNGTPTMNRDLVKCFTDAGFEWGGDWDVPDGMHFQIAKIHLEEVRLAQDIISQTTEEKR